MTLRLSDWASVAEIVSGFAVVATLVFLIAGIRENTNTTRAAVYGDLIASLNDMDASGVRDPDVARLQMLLFQGQPELMDASDLVRVNGMMRILFRNYERAWFSWRYGVLGEVEWRRFERLICSNAERFSMFAFGVDVRDFEGLTEEFRAYIDEACFLGTEG